MNSKRSEALLQPLLAYFSSSQDGIGPASLGDQHLPRRTRGCVRTPGWALLSLAVSLGLTLRHPFFWLPFSPPFSLPFLSPRPTHRITLLEAARIGLIPRTTRRLTRGERADLIDDGAVRPLPLLSSAQGRFVCSTHRARLRIWPPSLLTRPFFCFLCRTGVHLGGAGDADAGPSLNALLVERQGGATT